MKTCEDLLVLLYNLDEFSILVGEFLILVLSIVAGGGGGSSWVTFLQYRAL